MLFHLGLDLLLSLENKSKDEINSSFKQDFHYTTNRNLHVSWKGLIIILVRKSTKNIFQNPRNCPPSLIYFLPSKCHGLAIVSTSYNSYQWMCRKQVHALGYNWIVLPHGIFFMFLCIYLDQTGEKKR